MCYLTNKEIELLRLLVKHAENEGVYWHFDGVTKEIPLNKQEYDTIMRQLENYGAIEARGDTTDDPVYAVDFTIKPGATQLLRNLEYQKKLQKDENRKVWLKRAEKLIWMSIGAVITIVITIVIMWIKRKIGLSE
jgi:hypothetical protein